MLTETWVHKDVATHLAWGVRNHELVKPGYVIQWMNDNFDGREIILKRLGAKTAVKRRIPSCILANARDPKGIVLDTIAEMYEALDRMPPKQPEPRTRKVKRGQVICQYCGIEQPRRPISKCVTCGGGYE